MTPAFKNDAHGWTRLAPQPLQALMVGLYVGEGEGEFTAVVQESVVTGYNDRQK